MSTMKRRIIYVDDESWKFWKGKADAAGLTMSNWVRVAVHAHYVLPRGITPMQETVRTVEEHELTPQQKRDAILRRINTKER